jgi:hypothetical protein
MDMVPYFQQGCSPDEIMRWIPTLTAKEIAVAETYYRQHKAELDEQDRRVRDYRAEQIHRQRLRFPVADGTKEERMARLRQLLHQHRQEKNGEGDSG